jgi:hypothetical protein
MQKIGEICQLQVQTASLKAGDRQNRFYDPTPLRSAPALQIERRGVSAELADGLWIDIHHASHPDSKNRGGVNGLSFNFLGHYSKMQERFGAHLTPGIAGENILIDTDEEFALQELSGGLAIQLADGRLIQLTEVVVAAPCAPFSTFALNLDAAPPPDLLKAALQFLDGGTRGFYGRYGGEAVTLHLGQTVYRLAARRGG